MSERARRVILSCVVILATACLCVLVLGALEIGLLSAKPITPLSQVNPTDPPAAGHLAITPTATPQPLKSPTQTAPLARPILASPTPELPDAPLTEGLSVEITAGMDQIQRQVIQIRGLQASAPVTRSLITKDELKAKIRSDLLVNYTQQDAQNDVSFYSSLGLLDPHMDFYQFYQDLLGEQVAGYYDDQTKDMYVVQGEGFSGAERFTYAHEYNHALQDQNYDLEHGLSLEDAKCKAEADRCQADQALIEGDSTISSLNWLTKFGTLKDIEEILGSANTDMPIFNSAPAFLQKDFLFAYQQGQVFVQSLMDAGGWDAVNQAFLSPPLTTEQILHPSRYPDDQPVQVTLPDVTSTLGTGWQKVKETTLGEWYTYLMLADGRDTKWRLDDSKAQRAAEGWGGDRCEVFTNQGNQTVLILRTNWDDSSEASQFASAFQDFAARRFSSQPQNQNNTLIWQSDGEYTLFQLDGDQTTWVLAPDQSTAASVWQAIQ